MAGIDDILARPRPGSIATARQHWPQRESSYPSPADWRHECLYFFLPDRFSNVFPADRPPMDRRALRSSRGVDPATGTQRITWPDDVWQAWATSGFTRFQGGTLAGATQRLDYLHQLGVTAVWVGPVWKQSPAAFVNQVGQPADSYHGYAVQDFFDVDPRFGTRRDLVDFVAAAHDRRIRVIFDIIVNHTGRNWAYQVGGDLRPLERDPLYDKDHHRRYEFGAWLGGLGEYLPGPDDQPFTADQAVWPRELQHRDLYSRYGERIPGDDTQWRYVNELAPEAPYRRFDMYGRDLDLRASAGPAGTVLDALIAIWTYWIGLTDCDGFRVDTLKHIEPDHAEQFCNAVTEYAESIGKADFLILGEIGQAFSEQEQLTLEELYLRNLGSSLDAVLALESRYALRQCAFDGTAAKGVLDGPSQAEHLPSSHRALGSAFVVTVDDHDGLGSLERFPVKSFPLHPPVDDTDDVEDYFEPLQAVPGLAHLLFTVGIPCIYYGLEQGLAGPARGSLGRLPSWRDAENGGDRYLREAMFGPPHPRMLGPDGVPAVPGAATDDVGEPGFGPFGTSGGHLFDTAGAVFRRAALLCSTRRGATALQTGRQYWRPVTRPGTDAEDGPATSGVVAWSRILARTEYLVVVNVSPPGARSTQVLVDAEFNPPDSRMRVVASTAQCDGLATHLDAGTLLPVVHTAGGAAVTVSDLPAHEVVVLTPAVPA